MARVEQAERNRKINLTAFCHPFFIPPRNCVCLEWLKWMTNPDRHILDYIARTINCFILKYLEVLFSHVMLHFGLKSTNSVVGTLEETINRIIQLLLMLDNLDCCTIKVWNWADLKLGGNLHNHHLAAIQKLELHSTSLFFGQGYLNIFKWSFNSGTMNNIFAYLFMMQRQASRDSLFPISQLLICATTGCWV